MACCLASYSDQLRPYSVVDRRSRVALTARRNMRLSGGTSTQRFSNGKICRLRNGGATINKLIARCRKWIDGVAKSILMWRGGLQQ